MIGLYQEVFDKLKTDLLAQSEYSPQVFKMSPQQMSTFPVVEVVEINNILQEEALDKTEQFNKLSYEINIYTQDNSSGVSKVVIAEELRDIVDEVMSNHFGMNRTLCQRMANLDMNVYRIILRYECVLDNERLVIYRRR